jgi:hypothetical protein
MAHESFQIFNIWHFLYKLNIIGEKETKLLQIASFKMFDKEVGRSNIVQIKHFLYN